MELEEAIIEQIHEARKGDLIERDFPRARRKAYGHLVQHFDQVESCASLMHSAVSRGAHPFDFLKAHEALSTQDILECLGSWIDPGSYGISLVKPMG
jgi:predicted Zn-dependent peptidase